MNENGLKSCKINISILKASKPFHVFFRGDKYAELKKRCFVIYPYSTN